MTATTSNRKSRRPKRSARLEARVEPRLYAAVETFADDNGYTLSSALCRILQDWEKAERRRRQRRKNAD